MEVFYLVIICFLLLLAVFDLFVGVSNDAVNFLNSAIGAKAGKFRTVLIVASLGVVVGAVMSSGMMDVARHGIMNPVHYSFSECMTIFLAVMVTDVIILDTFNTLGLPTSTTVSLVFELLGASFVLALIKMAGNPEFALVDLINSDKALSVIIAIFVSVAIAFVLGTLIQWITRMIFTFNYTKHLRYTVAIFGGIAFTSLAYFIFLKGLGKSPYLPVSIRDYVDANTPMLLVITFVISTIVMELLHLCKIDVFKFIVFMGTFALAMAFAGNDLVNFIGVPLAGLDSYNDFIANGNGDANGFLMKSLAESAKTPPSYLLAAGLVMIVAMVTSKKAQNVVKTSVDLSRQDEGDEMFGSSKAARSIVRFTKDTSSFITRIIPPCFFAWLDKRFKKDEAILANGAAFDMVRAAVNLVLSSMLITIGTNYKLPLSTTYVTFMVAMGTSLADRAWSRESAVFRVTGVLSVIGGWFVTAGVAFAVSAIVCGFMHYGGFLIMLAFMALDIYLLVRSNMKYQKKAKDENKPTSFTIMMRSKDPDIVWDLLSKSVNRTQSFMTRFALEQFNSIIDGLYNSNLKLLRRADRELNEERKILKKYRRRELLGLRRCPPTIAIERNTWFHLGANSDQQFVYCLKRMLEPIIEHVDNNFTPMSETYKNEFNPIRQHVESLMKDCERMISTTAFVRYDEVLEEADNIKDELSKVRKTHIDRMQNGNENLQTSLLYLNTIQETQEFLSIMRHQLRAAKKFLE